MTWVVWVAGHRHLLAAITASAVADAAPLLLYRWGHIPLMAQYLIISALGLYLLSLQRPRELRVSLCWVALARGDAADQQSICSPWSAAAGRRRCCSGG